MLVGGSQNTMHNGLGKPQGGARELQNGGHLVVPPILTRNPRSVG